MDDAHKARILHDGPVGRWRTSAGTADVLGGGDVRFNPDGTGTVTTRSMMRGAEEEAFLWAMAGPARLHIRTLPQPGDEPDDPDDPDQGITLRLVFRRQRNDVGELDVLTQEGAGEGFWFLGHPLRWVDPAEDVVVEGPSRDGVPPVRVGLLSAVWRRLFG